MIFTDYFTKKFIFLLRKDASVNNEDRKRKFIIDTLFALIIIILVIIAVKYLVSPLIPFITAFAITACSQKAISFIASKTPLSKKGSTIFFTIFLISSVAAILYGILYVMFREFSALYEQISVESFQSFSELAGEYFSSFIARFGFTKHSSELIDFLFSAENGILYKAASDLIPKILSFLVSFFKLFPAAVVSVAFVLISLFYIGFDYDKITSFFYLQIGEKATKNFTEAKNIFTSTVKNIFRAYFLLAFITFVQLFCGFVVMKIKYAFILSLLICIIDILPILGTGTVLIPWSLFCFISGNYKIGGGILTMYAVITIFRQLAEPKIVGANIGLSPLLSLVSMYLGLKLMGFLGIIVFPICLITVINLNEKGILRLYRNYPESNSEKILKSKKKFLDFKKNDEK